MKNVPFLTDIFEGDDLTELVESFSDYYHKHGTLLYHGDLDDWKFVPKLKSILSQRQKSHRVSNKGLIDTNSVDLTNDGPIEQEASSPEISRTFSSSASIESTSEFGTESSLGLSVTAGFDFLVKAESTLSYESGISTEQSESTSNTTTFERTVTAPSQTVKVKPHSKVKVTINFFSTDIIITYLVDAELDQDTHFLAKPRLFGEIIPEIPIRMGEIKDFIRQQTTYKPLHEQSIHFTFEDGKVILKNIPMVLRTKGYHTEVIIGNQY